jgi:hypothetical protein
MCSTAVNVIDLECGVEGPVGYHFATAARAGGPGPGSRLAGGSPPPYLGLSEPGPGRSGPARACPPPILRLFTVSSLSCARQVSVFQAGTYCTY